MNLEPIATVVEGGTLNICVNLICSGITLGNPLNVSLDVIDNKKTGQCSSTFLKLVTNP